MNWLDYTLLGVVAVSALISLLRGFIKEVLSLLIWISAFWVAFYFLDELVSILTPYLEVASVRMAISFAILFLGTLLVGGVVNYLLGLLISKTGLSSADRLFGLFFGVFRGMLIGVIFVFFAGMTPLPQDAWWQRSYFIPYFQNTALWLTQFMPAEVSQYMAFGKEVLTTVPSNTALIPQSTSHHQQQQQQQGD